MTWLYWQMRAYRYDTQFQKIMIQVFWDGVNSAQGGGGPLRKEDLQ